MRLRDEEKPRTEETDEENGGDDSDADDDPPLVVRLGRSLDNFEVNGMRQSRKKEPTTKPGTSELCMHSPLAHESVM